VRGDFVRVPPPQAYSEPVNWHRTALHELSHWSGSLRPAPPRFVGSFGSKNYAREELVQK
jgi:antirestriction protein ArdC